MPVLNAHWQENPHADLPRGLVYVNRSEGLVFPNTNSITSQVILEIPLRGPGIMPLGHYASHWGRMMGSSASLKELRG